MGEPRRLWEPEHAYHCSDTNYYSADTAQTFDSWDLFLEEEGGSDLDYNLVFRWDWDRKARALTVYYVGQRKGLFRSVKVRGMHADDEPAVRAWLTTRWEHLRALWAPISDVEVSRG